MAIRSEFTRGHNSFSGVDIKAVFGTKSIGTLQGISYSISREKAPIYTMGSADPRAFARGKRGIAGSLVFIQFDTEPLLEEMSNLKFIADVDDLRPQYTAGQGNQLTNPLTATPAVAGPGSVNVAGAGASAQETDLGTTVFTDQQVATPWYPDQIPPFDVVLAATNEYGAVASMQILGVELLNSGYGVSIDDIVSEHSYTYIAHGILPWRYEADLRDQLIAASGGNEG